MGQRGAVDHYGDHGLTTPVYADDQMAAQPGVVFLLVGGNVMRAHPV